MENLNSKQKEDGLLKGMQKMEKSKILSKAKKKAWFLWAKLLSPMIVLLLKNRTNQKRNNFV